VEAGEALRLARTHAAKLEAVEAALQRVEAMVMEVMAPSSSPPSSRQALATASVAVPSAAAAARREKAGGESFLLRVHGVAVPEALRARRVSRRRRSPGGVELR
jgi:hypothetical protein